VSAANRVLLVSPAFHGYWKSIQRAFQTLGYDVRSHVYDDYTTIGSKIHNKLVYELPDRVRPAPERHASPSMSPRPHARHCGDTDPTSFWP